MVLQCVGVIGESDRCAWLGNLCSWRYTGWCSILYNDTSPLLHTSVYGYVSRINICTVFFPDSVLLLHTIFMYYACTYVHSWRSFWNSWRRPDDENLYSHQKSTSSYSQSCFLPSTLLFEIGFHTPGTNMLWTIIYAYCPVGNLETFFNFLAFCWFVNLWHFTPIYCATTVIDRFKNQYNGNDCLCMQL